MAQDQTGRGLKTPGPAVHGTKRRPGPIQSGDQLTGQSAVPKVAIPPHALTADINANNVQKDAAVVNAINEFVTASVNGFKVDGDPCKKR